MTFCWLPDDSDDFAGNLTIVTFGWLPYDSDAFAGNLTIVTILLVTLRK